MQYISFEFQILSARYLFNWGYNFKLLILYVIEFWKITHMGAFDI